MAALNDRFWAKVLFSQFIKHFRKMSDEQIVADIKQSMDDLEDLKDEGTSFGAKMVRWSMERADEPFAVAARENGKKGGRPRKNSSEQDEALVNQQRVEGDSIELRGDSHSPSTRTLPLPSWEEFLSYVDGEGLDYTDAREWWEMTMVDRDGKDRDGKPIKNWKMACRRFCEAKAQKRRSA